MTSGQLEHDVSGIIQWPPETWSDEEIRKVHECRRSLQRQMFELADNAERFNRNLTDEERLEFTTAQGLFDKLGRLVPSQR